jgi:hypothetical protein
MAGGYLANYVTLRQSRAWKKYGSLCLVSGTGVETLEVAAVGSRGYQGQAKNNKGNKIKSLTHDSSTQIDVQTSRAFFQMAPVAAAAAAAAAHQVGWHACLSFHNFPGPKRIFREKKLLVYKT